VFSYYLSIVHTLAGNNYVNVLFIIYSGSGKSRSCYGLIQTLVATLLSRVKINVQNYSHLLVKITQPVTTVAIAILDSSSYM